MTAPGTQRKLLVAAAVILIIGVAVVAILKYAVYVADNQAKACEQEYKSVQAGLVAYMANVKLDTVEAAGPTSDMTKPLPLYPTFVRNSSTTYAYGWESTGRVISISEASNNGPNVPVGCVVSG